MLDLSLLADAASTSDPQLSGAWVLDLVAKIFVGLGVLFGAVWAAYRKGLATPSTETTIKAPVPEVTTREAPDFAETKTLDEHKERTDERFAEFAQDIDQIHTRLNAAFKVLNTLEGTVVGINDNVGRLLDRAMGLPPGTTVSRQRKAPN